MECGRLVRLAMTKHKGWYSRGYLPHLDKPGLIQSITYRLADSLPKHVLDSFEDDPKWRDDVKRRKQVEALLDSGLGNCYLKQRVVAELVLNNWQHFDEKRYRLIAWCIMPNHIHVLVLMFEHYPLADVIRNWKSYTAHHANKILDLDGRFWAVGYFDRYIRDERHLETVINYIHRIRLRLDWLSVRRIGNLVVRGSGRTSRPHSSNL